MNFKSKESIIIKKTKKKRNIKYMR